MSIEITGKAPQGFKNLAWDVFFKSRHRGVSLECHFPFVGLEKAYYVTITLQGETVAGLAVIPMKGNGTAFVAGIVGLVCVHPAHRGMGHSTAMLHAAIRHARELQLDDLILWTSKPGVYRTLGFEVHDTAVFGSVTAKADRTQGPAEATHSVWPHGGDGRGLPPFASRAHEWRNTVASIIVLEDANGLILAEWNGRDEHVLGLISQVMPDKWRINALGCDRLPGLLEKQAWELDLRPMNLQMIMNLRKRAGEVDPYKLRILDRI